MKKTIFITGIAGLLGSNISYLLKEKYNICGIDRNPIDIKGVDSIVGSVTDFDMLKELILDKKPDYIIHCAALVNVDKCEQEEEYAWLINYELTKLIAEICAANNIKLIFISSDAVFPGTKTGLNTEQDKVAPISVYGKTKAAAEEVVLKTDLGLVVRTNIYGYNFRNKNSFGEWVKKSLEDNIELNMFYDLWFSPILVNELTDILDRCMEENICGVYHICGTGSISKYDMALLIKREFDLEGTVNKASMKSFEFVAPRTQNMGMDNSSIKKKLNIEISTSEESVRLFKKLQDEGYPEKLKKGGY